jgi:hypothetical protein
MPFVNAEVTLAVERVLKPHWATVGALVTVLMGGQLVPDYDLLNETYRTPQETWVLKELGYSEVAPLLLPGDRALLFLELGSDNRYSVQSVTGQYAVGADEKLQALPGNPFAPVADGKPLDEFLAAVAEALAQPAAP